MLRTPPSGLTPPPLPPPSAAASLFASSCLVGDRPSSLFPCDQDSVDSCASNHCTPTRSGSPTVMGRTHSSCGSSSQEDVPLYEEGQHLYHLSEQYPALSPPTYPPQNGASPPNSVSKGGNIEATGDTEERYPSEVGQPWHSVHLFIPGCEEHQGAETCVCTRHPATHHYRDSVFSRPHDMHHHDEQVDLAVSSRSQTCCDYQVTHPQMARHFFDQHSQHYADEIMKAARNTSWVLNSSLPPSPLRPLPIVTNHASLAQPLHPSLSSASYYSSSLPSTPFCTLDHPTAAATNTMSLSSSAPPFLSGSGRQSSHDRLANDNLTRPSTSVATSAEQLASHHDSHHHQYHYHHHHGRVRPRFYSFSQSSGSSSPSPSPSPSSGSHYPHSHRLKLRLLSSYALSRHFAHHLHHHHRHHRHHSHHRKKSKNEQHAASVQHRALELPELRYLIGLYLEPRSLAACVRVCKSWWLAFMPLLWNTITSRNGLSSKLTIDGLRRYGHLIRTVADISHDCLVQKFYHGQIRHLTELCVDMEHIRQSLDLEGEGRLPPAWYLVEAIGNDYSNNPHHHIVMNNGNNHDHHTNHINLGHYDFPLNQAGRRRTEHLLRSAALCTDIVRRNMYLTRLEWAGLDTEPLWILNTDVYSRLPNLTMLYLKHWQVSQESFEWILQSCPRLETLVLDHVHCFGSSSSSSSDAYFRHLGLRHIVIHEHSYPVLRHFPDLERLTINVMGNLNAVQLADDIRRYCPLMKELEVDDCDHIIDRDIALLIEAVPQLVTLNLYCWYWSSHVVQALLKHHSNTIEVVNASDGAMDREGNLYLNHSFNSADGNPPSKGELHDFQMLFVQCQRLRVFKVPWHGLPAFELALEERSRTSAHGNNAIDNWQCCSLETLWILINDMDTALEIQQLMTELSARPTTAKQRTWIAELKQSHEAARAELRVLKKKKKQRQRRSKGKDKGERRHVDQEEESSMMSDPTTAITGGQGDQWMGIYDDAAPLSPPIPLEPTASVVDWQDFIQPGSSMGGWSVSRSKSIETNISSTWTLSAVRTDGSNSISCPTITPEATPTTAVRHDRDIDAVLEEEQDEKEEAAETEHNGMEQALKEMASTPSKRRERLRDLIREYLQHFPRLERLSLGTGEYILVRH